MGLSEQQIYCSLDLELTGFDPLVDEILEIGAVWFTIDESGAHTVKEWSQVVRPSKDVRPKILALTGIRNAEISGAPTLNEVRDHLAAELEGSILVGHNIGIDVSFLQSAGIVAPSQNIDTLQLVQWLLPSHHSYNLENLMHLFSVHHLEAHRALDDAKATVELLEQLLSVFNGLPEDLKAQIRTLAEAKDFTWKELLVISLPPRATPQVNLKASDHDNSLTVTSIPDGEVVDMPLGTDRVQSFLNSQLSEPTLLVVSKKSKVLQLWQQGKARGVFSSSDVFSKEKFKEFLEAHDLTNEEALFALKILVWLATNWQHETILDLNLSFSGNQFRSLVTGRALQFPDDITILAVTDYQTFLEVAKSGGLIGHSVFIDAFDRFESELRRQLGTKASWQRALYILRSVYNPETGFGKAELAAKVLEAIAGTDLFFSLVNLSLRQAHVKAVGPIVREALDDYYYSRVKQAGESFRDMLLESAEVLEHDGLRSQAHAITEFFSESGGVVRWIEAGETNCSLVSQPLDLSSTAEKIFGAFPKGVHFFGSLGSPVLNQFFLERLGVPKYNVTTASSPSPKPVPIHRIYDTLPTPQLLIEQLPTAVLFSDEKGLREFYDTNFEKLKTSASVFALGYSGGPTKLLRNFALRKQSLLLVTADFISAKAPTGLLVKHLILQGFPEARVSDHPYLQAQGNEYGGGVSVFTDVLSQYRLHVILEAFASPMLEKFTVIASPHPSDAMFTSYLKNLAMMKISE